MYIPVSHTNGRFIKNTIGVVVNLVGMGLNLHSVSCEQPENVKDIRHTLNTINGKVMKLLQTAIHILSIDAQNINFLHYIMLQ